MSNLTPKFNGEKWDVEQVIQNATIEPYPQNGEYTLPVALYITPISGYVLHDKGRDYTRKVVVKDKNGAVARDKNNNVVYTETFYRGYTDNSAVCGIDNYSFETAIVELDGAPTTVYGNREFCAVKKT